MKKQLFVAYASVLLIACFGVAKALTIPAVSIPDQPYLFDTNLSVGIGSSDSSMVLVSGTLKNNTSLSGYYCFTIDIGTSKTEYVCGTASGTSITSMLRGVDPLNPLTQVTALKFSHRAGADVRITDFPGLQIMKRLSNGQDPYPNALLYDQAVNTTTLQSNSLNLASVAYVNSVALSGAPNATTTSQGVVQFATPTQLSAGTIQGSTGAFLVPANGNFSSTFKSATTVPVTMANGLLSSSFTDQTASYTWSALHTFNGAVTQNATTTLAATSTAPLTLRGVTYNFPASQGQSNTFLTNNGSGSLTWATSTAFASGLTTKAMTDASFAGTSTISTGLTGVRFFKVTATNSISQQSTTATGIWNNNGNTVASTYADQSGQPYGENGGSTSVILHLIGSATNGSAYQEATITVSGGTITLAWTKTNSPTGTAQLVWEAQY